MKKLLAAVMVISMCIITVSCSSKNNDEVTGVFSSENISLDEDFTSVSDMKLSDNQIFLLGVHRKPDYTECTEIAKYEIDSKSVTYITFDEINTAIEFAVCGDETILAIAEYDGETGEESYKLVKYFGDEKIWEKSLDEIISTEEVYADDIHIESAQDKWYLAAGNTFVQLSGNGESVLTKKLPNIASGLFVESGTIHVYGDDYHYTYDQSYGLTESDNWKRAFVAINDKRTFISISGNLYYSTDLGIIRYDIADNRKTPVLNWVNSGIIESGVNLLVVQSDETMYSYGFDINGVEKFFRLTKADMDFSDREIVKITYIEDGNNSIPLAAIRFNSMQDEYYILCDEYKSKYLSEDYETITSNLDLDIVSGKIGDIIVFEDISALRKYAERGILEDIYELETGAFTKDNIFNCVKKFCELDGKLYVIPREFRVETLVAKADSKIDSDTWTIEAYLDTVASLGDDTRMLQQTSRDSILDLLLPYVVCEFVDMESRSCKFDNEQFYSFLNYVKSLPENAVVEYEYGKNYYINGEIQLYKSSIGCYADFARSRSIYGSIDGGKVVGYPSKDGGVSNINANQYFAVKRQSRVKNGAIEFMEYLFSIESVVDANKGMRRIPSLKSTMNGWRESESKIFYYFYIDDLSTYNISYDSPITFESEGIPGVSVEMNDEMIDEINIFLDNLSVASPISDIIIGIVREEIVAYCGNVRSQEETSKIIEHRVGTYLSEQQ